MVFSLTLSRFYLLIHVCKIVDFEQIFGCRLSFSGSSKHMKRIKDYHRIERYSVDEFARFLILNETLDFVWESISVAKKIVELSSLQ